MSTRNTTTRRALTGTVAAATGVVILVGGAGTFATWSDGAALPQGDVTTGSLHVEEWHAGTWTDQNRSIENITEFRMVPGDVLTRSDEVEIIVHGDNLNIDVTLTGGITNLPEGVTARVEIADSFNTENLDSSDEPQTVPVELTVEFAPTADGTMDTDVILNGIQASLTHRVSN